ncbi:LPXTG cell wall anchor domain-containing protein, partial [Leuconostoc mesenteroides]
DSLSDSQSTSDSTSDSISDSTTKAITGNSSALPETGAISNPNIPLSAFGLSVLGLSAMAAKRKKKKE